MKELFVTCPHGFEDTLAQELSSLGVGTVSPSFCGVFIPKSTTNVFIANYRSRVATRVLWPLAVFPCRGKDDLYYRSKKIAWDEFLTCDKTFAIDSNVQHPAFNNSMYASLVVKDAICDFFRNKTGGRPSVSVQFPDVQLNLFMQKGTAFLYFDTSGTPLHKRGWRQSHTEATLHESVAAGLLLLAGYNGQQTFCDPFCGSGTFLVEAGLIARNIAPGFFRKKWGFFHMPQCSKEDFLAWKKSIDLEQIPLTKGHIFGSDKSRENTEICKKHLQSAGLGNAVDVEYQEIAYYTPPTPPQMIVTNPPYGKRLETSVAIFQQLYTFIQTKTLPDSQTFLLAPNADLLTQASFTISNRLSFKNGGIPVQFFHVNT